MFLWVRNSRARFHTFLFYVEYVTLCDKITEAIISNIYSKMHFGHISCFYTETTKRFVTENNKYDFSNQCKKLIILKDMSQWSNFSVDG